MAARSPSTIATVHTPFCALRSNHPALPRPAGRQRKGSMKIINVSGMTPNDPSVVYCGRRTRNGWRESVLHNPFHIGKDSTREQVIANYRAYLIQLLAYGNRKILAALD